MIFLNVFSKLFLHAFTDECFATSSGDPVCIWRKIELSFSGMWCFCSSHAVYTWQGMQEVQLYLELFQQLTLTHSSPFKYSTSSYIILIGKVELAWKVQYNYANVMHSSYNLLPRAAGKIQYEVEAKLRPSNNCILPEAEEVGYN